MTDAGLTTTDESQGTELTLDDLTDEERNHAAEILRLKGNWHVKRVADALDPEEGN